MFINLNQTFDKHWEALRVLFSGYEAELIQPLLITITNESAWLGIFSRSVLPAQVNPK